MNVSKKQIAVYSMFGLALLIGLWIQVQIVLPSIYPKIVFTTIEYVGLQEGAVLQECVVVYVDELCNTMSITTQTETIFTVFTTTLSTDIIINRSILHVGVVGD